MTQRPARAKATNSPSKLLSNTENQTLYNIIGNKAVTLSSAIVQVYLAEAPNRGRWNKRCCGVATFIKDNQKRSYYIRVYNLKNRNMLWEQEIYTNFKYTQARPYFHTFEAHDSSAGLNFANEDEANQFHNTIIAKLDERAQRKMERRKTQANRPRPQPPRPTVTAPSLPPAPTTIDTGKNKEKENKKKDKQSGKKKKGKLTKEDIGTPSNFIHVGHVGWDPDKGFLDMDKLDPDMKSLFDQAGISKELLEDKDTATFIYDFIEKQGGIEAIKKEQQNRPLPPTPRAQPPPPAMPPARPPATHSAPTPPRPPPSRRSEAPPPPPPNRGPVPPPPSRNLPSRPTAASPPAPPSRGPPSAPPPPPPSMSGPPSAPPPPPPSRNMPPPPPPGGGPPPPPPPGPPPPPVAGGGPGGGRADLLSQIRGGTSLAHVEEPASSGGGGDGEGRDALLDQIRGGMTLKKVEQQERAPEPQLGGIAGALAAALNSRAKAVQGSYDSDSAEEDMDEDEWSD